MTADLSIPNDGWIAGRLYSDARDSFAQPIWAHTSPVYVKTGAASPERAEAARWFDDHIDKSLEWVTKKGKFYTDSQRKEVLDLFKQGQAVYKRDAVADQPRQKLRGRHCQLRECKPELLVVRDHARPFPLSQRREDGVVRRMICRNR